MPKVIITGAGGFLGSALVKHYSRKGWQVTALVRNADKYKSTKNVTYAEYDLTKPLNEKMFEKADYLVHTAYIKQDRKHPNALAANYKAAKRLITASRKFKLKKNVFISSMSAHGEAESVYGRQKLKIEGLFSSKKDISLRPGLIVGDGGIVKIMAQFIKSKHMVPIISGGKQPLQIISIYDLIKAIDYALQSNVNGVFTVANEEVYTYKNFYRALANRVSAKIIFVSVPYSLLMGVFKISNTLHLPLSVGEDNLKGLKQLKASDNKKDLQKLGIKPDDLQTALSKINIT